MFPDLFEVFTLFAYKLLLAIKNHLESLFQQKDGSTILFRGFACKNKIDSVICPALKGVYDLET
jgi:hypothetical protein